MNNLMKKGTLLAVMAVSLALAGCASNGLSERISALESAVAAAQSAANDASAMAENAQNTANQAMDSTRNAQACCEANSEKINRMFEKANAK